MDLKGVNKLVYLANARLDVGSGEVISKPDLAHLAQLIGDPKNIKEELTRQVDNAILFRDKDIL